MKSLLLFLGLTYSLFCSAQTLTQSFNEPVIGDIQESVRLDTSAYLTKIPVDSTGINFHWNYSKMHTASDPVTTNYVDPTTVPEATAYPACTVVQDNSGFYTFLKSVSTPTTRTEVLGLILPFGTTTFTNTGIAAVYPITAGASNTDNIAGTAVITGSTLPVSGKISYTADGTGTLTLADGFTYTNVLRLKTVLTITATLLILPVGNITQTTYDYYAPNEKFPVLSIGYQTFSVFGGSPSVTATYAGNSRSFTNIQEVSKRTSVLNMYPNPAQNRVFFSLDEPTSATAKIQIYNITGALVSEQSLNGATSVSVANLSAGVYQVLLLNGTARSSQKLVIQER